MKTSVFHLLGLFDCRSCLAAEWSVRSWEARFICLLHSDPTVSCSGALFCWLACFTSPVNQIHRFCFRQRAELYSARHCGSFGNLPAGLRLVAHRACGDHLSIILGRPPFYTLLIAAAAILTSCDIICLIRQLRKSVLLCTLLSQPLLLLGVNFRCLAF